MPSFQKYRPTMRCNLPKLILLFFAFTTFQNIQGQNEHLNFELRAELKRASDSKMIHLAAYGEVSEIEILVEQADGVILHRLKNFVVFRIPAREVYTLSESRAVTHLEFSSGKGVPLNDSMLVNNRVGPIHSGFDGWPEGLTGKDVVVGMVDTGIELLHPDFQNPDGTTRVKFLWDQTQSSGQSPQPYDYGAEWVADDIDAGITGHQDQPQYYGHGSTVTGTAAGNGLAVNNFKGVAPDADLVVVSSQFGGGNWTMKVADAVQYVFEKAEELDKPAVVNLSLGTYSGSRDGLDAAALIIDSLVSAQPGRVVVCAAGNSGNLPPYHLSYEVSADTAFTWFQYNANSGLGYGAVFFELWADTTDFQQVHFAIGADRVNPSLQFRGNTPFRDVSEILGSEISDTLQNNGNSLAVVDYFATVRGGQYQIQVHMQTPDSSQYRFRFMTTGEGVFDIWSTATFGASNMISTGLPDEATFPDIVDYRAPDKQKHIVGSWACSPKVITVGNYYNRDEYIDYNGNLQTFSDTPGQLSVNSSHGPTRDNRLKPEISASGDMTLSSGKFSMLAGLITNEPFKVAQGGMHYRNGGTSMASPVVSGAAALILEMCPDANWETVRSAMFENIYIDNFTGNEPNNAYGNGKLDVEAAIQSLSFQPEFDQPLMVELCAGESVDLGFQGEYLSYNWSNDEISPQISLSESGDYWAEVTNIFGCRGFSDTLSVEVNPLPQAEIWLAADTLFAAFDSSYSYQWLLDGIPIDGAVNNFLVPESDGVFSVEVESQDGCLATSDELAYFVTGLGAKVEYVWDIYPVPADGVLNISGSEPIERLALWSVGGQLIHQWENPVSQGGIVQLNLSKYPSGSYILLLEGDKAKQAVKFISR